MAKRKFSLIGEMQKNTSAAASDNISIPDGNNIGASKEEAPIHAKKDKSTTEIRATFIVDSRLVRKLKLIGMLESKKHKDVIGSAIAEYIEKWESEHPTVNLDKIDNMIIK